MMKNVLVLIYTPTYGGPHNQVSQMYVPLKNKGWNTIAVIPEGDDISFQRLTEVGVTVLRKPLARLRATKSLSTNWEYARSFSENVKLIEEVIATYDISLVQICGLMHVHGAIAARRKNVPVVWQLLSTFAPTWMRAVYTPIVSKQADVVMTTGDLIAKEHPFNFLFKKKHISFYPPVDTTQFIFNKDKRKEARKYLKVSDDSILIGTVGNQNRQKSHDVFIKIAGQLLHKDNLYFRIVGRHTPANAANYRQNVINPAKALQLFENEKLRIVDSSLPIATILNAFDIFLLTSHAEGVPTVILEAMATGLPIISSDVGAISEIVKQEKNGFIYPFGNIKQAVENIESLIDNIKLLENIKAANRKEAVEKYDVHACAEQHIYAYQQAILHHDQ